MSRPIKLLKYQRHILNVVEHLGSSVERRKLVAKKKKRKRKRKLGRGPMASVETWLLLLRKGEGCNRVLRIIEWSLDDHIWLGCCVFAQWVFGIQFI